MELGAEQPETRLCVFANVGAVILGVEVPRPVVVLIHQLLLAVEPLGPGQSRHNHSHREAAENK